MVFTQFIAGILESLYALSYWSVVLLVNHYEDGLAACFLPLCLLVSRHFNLNCFCFFHVVYIIEWIIMFCMLSSRTRCVQTFR